MSEKSSRLIHDMDPEMFRRSGPIKLIIWTSISLVILISIIDFTGWIFNFNFLMSVGPDWESMKLVTASCFILSASGLTLIYLELKSKWIRILLSLVVAVILFISLATVYIYLYALITSRESPLCQLLFFNLFLSPDNRMALLTSVCFLLTGYILYTLQSKNSRSVNIAYIALIPLFLISYFTFIAYILGDYDATGLMRVPIALNTAISLFSLGIAVLHIRPLASLIKLYNPQNTGGIVSRRLLPPAVVLPIVIGWLLIKAERSGVFLSEEGLIIVAIIYTSCFIFFVWLTARYINRIDLKRKASERTLRESREQLAAVFNSVSETLMLLDLNGNIIAANATAKNRFIRDNTELAGRNIYDLIPADYHKQRKEQISEIIRTRKPFKLENRLGDTILDLTLYPVIDMNNDVVQLVSFSVDITEKKKAEESLLSQSKMLEAVNDAIVGTDLELNIIYWNHGAERIYGWKPEEVKGKSVHSIFRSEIMPEDREAIYRNLNEGHPSVTELVQYTKENQRRIIEGYTIPLVDSGGNISSFVAINRDITERKDAEDALRESETKFFSIFHLSPVAMVLSSLKDEIYQDVNDVFLTDTGYSREEIVGKPWQDLNIFFDFSEHNRIINRVKNEGQIYGVPISFRLKNGNILPCLISINTISISGTSFLLSTIQDISEIMNTREALRQSEERFKAISEASPVGISVIDKINGSIHYINPAYEHYFGYNKDELLGKKAPDIFWDRSDREKIRGILNENNYVSNYELRLRRKDESAFWSMLSIRQISLLNKPALLTTFTDITKRKSAEDSLRISEQRLKFHIENSPLAVIEWGHDFVVTKWSGEAEKIFGWTKAEVVGLPIYELNMIFEDDIPIVERTMERLTGGKELQVVSENRNYTKNRQIRNCIWYNSVLLDETARMSSVMSLVEDVTDTRKVERLLKESEEKLWSVLNASQESIFMFDRSGVITMSNSTGMERMKIKSEKELIGHHLSEFLPVTTAEARSKNLQQVFVTGQPLEFEDVQEARMFSHNYFPVFKDGEVSYVVSYSADITERKRAEDNLRESEDRFRTIAESLPVLIAIYNIAESSLSFVNKTFERTFGFKDGELLNRKLPDTFFNPEEMKELGKVLKEKGRAYNREIKVAKADGTSFWLMASIRRIMFMNQPAYLTASINITETKKAQEELLIVNRTLDARSKSSQAMMHSKDEFSFLNEVCKIIIEDCGHSMVWVGYAQNDEKKSVKPVAYYGFDKGYVENMNITWDESEHGNGPTGTAIRKGKITLCKNMHTDPFFKPWRKAALERGYASSLTLPLILDEKPFGSISIYSKEPDPFTENEINLLSILVDDLAYGISFLRLEESERTSTKLIRENEAKLKELVATKDKFFNIVAHDLKNPFTSLIGSSELLFENLDQLNAKSIKDLAMILNDSAKSGYAILQNLLDWSRSQTGMLKINSEKVNLKDLINENLFTFQLPAANKEINILNDANQDIVVFADKNMINTILRNLLSNALKFTFKTGKIIITSALNDGEVIVSVKDNGMGIPKDKIDSLFRLDVKNSIPGTENEQGTGLGLKLSKEFVEKLGGRIWVESDESKGSTFSFSIPRKLKPS
jgi:PAS domain S-box-containing protein